MCTWLFKPLQKENKYLVMKTERFLELMGKKSDEHDKQSLMRNEEHQEEDIAA